MSFHKEQFLSVINGVAGDSFNTEADRIEARSAVAALLNRLRTPWETAAEHAWAQPATSAALKVAIDLQLFQKWVDTNGGAALQDAVTASLVNADPELTSRLLRHLGAMNLITTTSDDTHALTPFTKALADPTFTSYYGFLYSVTSPGFANMPKFLSETTYTNPTNASNTNWQHLSGESYFEFFAKHQKAREDFQNVMKINNLQKPSWTDVYHPDRLLKDLKPDRAILVDVGGGLGGDVEKLRAKHPDLPEGSLVLQDTAEVVAKTVVQQPIRAEGYDFFTPNPVKGARSYYMHRVLHDWADDKAISILKNQTVSMERGYSKILIHENVVSPAEKDYQVTIADLTMMMIASSKERTEKMWNGVLNAAGLKIVHIWRIPQAAEGIIEAELC